MATTADRNRVLSITLQTIDKLSPALKIAERALQKTAKIAKTITSGMVAGFRAVGRAIAALTNPANILRGVLFGLGVRGLFRFFEQVAEGAFQTEQFATRLGITTQALQELQFIGKAVGVQVNQLTIGLQRMERRIADAASGNKLLNEELTRLGLDAQELVNLELDEQFFRLADAIAQTDAQGKQVLQTFKFFDSEGVALLQVIEKIGGDRGALRDMVETARELGVVFSDEGIRRASEFRRELFFLKASFEGVRNEVALAFFPVFTEVFRNVRDVVVESRDEIGEWARDWAARFLFAGKAAGAFFELLKNLVQDTTSAELLGKILSEIGQFAVDVVVEVVTAALKILKSAFLAIFRPILNTIGLFGEQIAARFIARFRNELKTIATIPGEIVVFLKNTFGDTVGTALALASDFLRPFAATTEESLAELQEGIRNGIDAAAKVAEEKIVEAEETLGTAVQEAIGIIAEEARAGGAAIDMAFQNIANEFEELIANVLAAGGENAAIEQFRQAIEAARVAAAELRDSLSGLEDTIDATGQAAIDAWPQIRELSAASLARDEEMFQDFFARLQGSRAVAIREIEKAADAATAELFRLAKEGEISFRTFATGIAAIQADAARELVQFTGNFADGMKDEFQRFFDALKNQFEQGREFAADFIGVLESGFSDVFDSLIDGTKSVGEAFENLGKEVLKIIGQIIAKQVALFVVRSLFGAAKGAVIEHGDVQKFQTGGIVSRPTLFPTNTGLGVAGEAGPEAILPLRRGASGRLGVETTEESGAKVVNVTFQIDAVDTRGFQRLLNKEATTIEDMILRAMQTRKNFRDTIKAT